MTIQVHILMRHVHLEGSDVMDVYLDPVAAWTEAGRLNAVEKEKFQHTDVRYDVDTRVLR